MGRYPDTLETLTTLRTWSPHSRAYAVLAIEGGKLYLMAQVQALHTHTLDGLCEMYPGARFIVREIERNFNLPIHGGATDFYNAHGCEWQEAQIPFAGFYESHHSYEIERELTQSFGDDSGSCYHPELWQIGFDGCEFRAVELAYVQEYVDSFASETGIQSAIFSGIENPREYNFETDRAFAKITGQEVARIHGETDRATLERIAKERHTSRSGFISSYSPDVDSWGDVATWDHNQLGTLLLAFWETTQGDAWGRESEYGLTEDFSGNGLVGNWVWGAMDDKATRAGNLAYYLRERAGRGDGYEKTSAAFSEVAY